MASTLGATRLGETYPLTGEQVTFFRVNGYIKLKDVLGAEELAHYGAEISRRVREASRDVPPLEQRGTYGKAFLQVMNLWQKSEIVKELVFSPRLARLAAELMGCRGVRLYHDQALYKEPGGGITPWHADQFYWPVDTDKTCTVWIPLQATPLEMGPLAFAAGSQRYGGGRDVAISDESEQRISKALLEQGLPLDETPFDLGEVSYHLGWTYHRAGANRTGRAREVMTVIYLDAAARISRPRNKNQEADWQGWFGGAAVGSVPGEEGTPTLWGGRVGG